MDTPYLNYGFGLNSADSLNNQYLQAALMSKNVNFKGDSSQVAGVDSVGTGVQGGIPVTPSTQQASKGSSNFVTGALATVLVGGGALWLLKSGKFSKAGNAIKSIVGKGGSSEKPNTVLTQLRAIKNGNGELKIQVPNKTKTFAGTHINSGANEYGINGAIRAERQIFNPETSALRGFQVDTPVGRYTVFTKDGQISKILEGHKDVSEQMATAGAKTTDGELLDQFKKIVAELGKSPKEVDKAVLKDVVNIGYVNKYGDDALKLTMAKYGEAPQLKAFRTLEQFDKSSTAVRTYIPSSAEEVFANDLVDKTGGWFCTKGVLADGVKVLECEENIAGARCFFEGGKLVKIKLGGVVYPSESIGFKDFVKTNEKAIEQFKQDVFTDKIANKIPVGAIIGAA